MNTPATVAAGCLKTICFKPPTEIYSVAAKLFLSFMTLAFTCFNNEFITFTANKFK